MQGQDGSGYFVRLGPATDPRGAAALRRATTTTRRARRSASTRVNFRFRPLTLIGLLLLGWLGWAATTPGGVSARVHGISNKLQSLVDDATTDPGLKRAANYYNQRYTEQGAYPQLSEQDLRDDPDAGWGVGVETEWCSRDAMVLTSLTGSGTISRLLYAGEDLGDVHGLHHCPVGSHRPAALEAQAVDGRGSSPAAFIARPRTCSALASAMSAPSPSRRSTSAGSASSSAYRCCTGRRNSTTASATVVLNVPYCWPANSFSMSAMLDPVTAP